MKSKNHKEDAEGIAMKCRESVAEAFPKPSKEPKPPKAWRNAEFAFITGHAVKGMKLPATVGKVAEAVVRPSPMETTLAYQCLRQPKSLFKVGCNLRILQSTISPPRLVVP